MLSYIFIFRKQTSSIRLTKSYWANITFSRRSWKRCRNCHWRYVLISYFVYIYNYFSVFVLLTLSFLFLLSSFSTILSRFYFSSSPSFLLSFLFRSPPPAFLFCCHFFCLFSFYSRLLCILIITLYHMYTFSTAVMKISHFQIS